MHDLPAELNGRAFHVRDADALGVPRGRLTRKALVTPYRGTRVRADDVNFELLVAACAARMLPGQAISHITAARLWRLRLPFRPTDEPLHVTAIHPTRAPRVPGIVGHHAHALNLTELEGIPVVAPDIAWVQLGSSLPLDEVIIAGDGLVCRKHPLSSMERLRTAVDVHGCGRGVINLRAALTEIVPGTDSARETMLRLLLRRAGLPVPEVNGQISEPGATPRRFGDLVFRTWGVVVEYEGEQHTDRVEYLRDIARYEELRRWRFVRVTKEHLRDGRATVSRVSSALREEGWPG